MFSQKGLEKKTASNKQAAMMRKAKQQVESENMRKSERSGAPASKSKKASESPGMISKMVGSFWGGSSGPQDDLEKKKKEGDVALIKIKQYLVTFPSLKESGIKAPPANSPPEEKIHVLQHIRMILGSDGAEDQIHDTLFLVANGLLTYIDSNPDLARQFPLSGPRFSLAQALQSPDFKKDVAKECKELAIEYAEWLSASPLKRLGRKIMYLTWNIRQGNLQAMAEGERQSAKYDEL